MTPEVKAKLEAMAKQAWGRARFPVTTSDFIELCKEFSEAGYAEGVRAAAAVKWSYCPECGADEDTCENNAYNPATGRLCRHCRQGWWTDVDYTEAIKENLATRNPPAEGGEE